MITKITKNELQIEINKIFVSENDVQKILQKINIIVLDNAKGTNYWDFDVEPGDSDEVQYIAKAKEFRTEAEAQKFEKQKEMERKQ